MLALNRPTCLSFLQAEKAGAMMSGLEIPRMILTSCHTQSVQHCSIVLQSQSVLPCRSRGRGGGHEATDTGLMPPPPLGAGEGGGGADLPMTVMLMMPFQTGPRPPVAPHAAPPLPTPAYTRTHCAYAYPPPPGDLPAHSLKCPCATHRTENRGPPILHHVEKFHPRPLMCYVP